MHPGPRQMGLPGFCTFGFAKAGTGADQLVMGFGVARVELSSPFEALDRWRSWLHACASSK